MANVNLADVTAPVCIRLPTFVMGQRACYIYPDSRAITLTVHVLQAAPELSAEQKAELQQQAEKFEGQVSSHPDDLEALEGAGVTYAQLGDYRRAEALLAKLTSAKSDDAEAWRLLVPAACALGLPV